MSHTWELPKDWGLSSPRPRSSSNVSKKEELSLILSLKKTLTLNSKKHPVKGLKKWKIRIAMRVPSNKPNRFREMYLSKRKAFHSWIIRFNRIRLFTTMECGIHTMLLLAFGCLNFDSVFFLIYSIWPKTFVKIQVITVYSVFE